MGGYRRPRAKPPKAGGKPGRQRGGAGATVTMARRPKLFVFDLDDTVWYPEMYMLSGAPFKKDQRGRVFDRAGEEVVVYPAAMACPKELATADEWKGAKIAYASRTHQKSWAMKCLELIEVPDAGGLSLLDISAHIEIQSGTKCRHFENLHRASGIPYEDMIFFDNERWNITEVSGWSREVTGGRGVTCVYTPDGMIQKFWENGLRDHANA